MNYTASSSADFICDEYFQNWVIRPDEESERFWNNWLLQHPAKRETVEEARNVLLHIKLKEDLPPEEQVQQSLESTLNSIQEEDLLPAGPARVIPLKRLKLLWRVAAVFLIIVLAGVFVYQRYWNAKEFLSTEYGEIKKLVLPDGSRVVLNAHSTISYFKHVSSSRPRQVWLDGEAFFDVTHVNKDEKHIKVSDQFIVTTNDLAVRVLGTSFDVKKRGRLTEVILATGKIRIEFNDRSRPAINMVPGQMIAYDESHTPSLATVDPAIYTSWMDKKLILRGVSVYQIAQDIQDYYGYKVVLEDPALGNKKMEGPLLLDDMNDVLFVLSTTLNVKIEKQGMNLVFKKRK